MTHNWPKLTWRKAVSYFYLNCKFVSTVTLTSTRTYVQDASQYESMLRLVAAHRSSLLEATRRHVAQALQASGDLRAAENYYIQAGEHLNVLTVPIETNIRKHIC